jgi:hypothetical protein
MFDPSIAESLPGNFQLGLEGDVIKKSSMQIANKAETFRFVVEAVHVSCVEMHAFDTNRQKTS